MEASHKAFALDEQGVPKRPERLAGLGLGSFDEAINGIAELFQILERQCYVNLMQGCRVGTLEGSQKGERSREVKMLNPAHLVSRCDNFGSF